MNNQRRKALDEVAKQIEAIKLAAEALKGQIEEAKEALEALLEEEQDYYDAMPEGIQQSERGERAEAAVSALENAVGNLEEMADACGTVDEQADEAMEQMEEAKA